MTRLIRLFVLSVMIASLFGAAQAARADGAKADLSLIKTYLQGKTDALRSGSEALKVAGDSYYALAKDVQFDYAALWASKQAAAAKALADAKAAWVVISPLYEQIEGIVAGVPTLQPYDPILDSGVKGEVEFDLTLPDGSVIAKPGNLYGLLETSLWGTDKAHVKQEADLNDNGKIDFGDVLPDANFVKGAADGMAKYMTALNADAAKWTPTESDAFTALVVMVPTMKEYFAAWKNSRFIMGDKADSGEFSVISRLADVQDIVGSLQVIYTGVAPLVTAKSAALDREISSGLTDLHDFAADLYKQEQAGKKFTPEQADIFAGEAQSNADVITGRVAQIAAQLDIKLANN